MKNAFGVRQVGDFSFDAESDPGFAERSAAQDQVAIVWTPEGEVIAASPVSSGGRGPSRMEIARFPAGTDFESGLSLKRTREYGLPRLTRSTQFLTAVTDHSERTQILALDGEKLSLDDAMLLEWLVNAERQMLLGTDNHPVFETSLEETACGIARLPNGLVSMTEVPRNYVDSMASRVRMLANESPATYLNLTVETPLRCLARYFLTMTPEGADTLHAGRRSEATAFLGMNRSGYSFGLFSPSAGLFSENGFLAPDEVNKKKRPARNQTREVEPAPADDDRILNEYVRKALDQLQLQMSPEKIENMHLSGYTQVVYAAQRGLMERIAPFAAEITERAGVEFIALPVPVEEAVAYGLLLGSHSFGSNTVAGARNVTPVNLARDILVLADSEESERRREEEVRMLARRNRAVLQVLAPPVIAAGILLALVASLIASGFFTAIRESQADAHAQELRPALERRKAYEANLKWYQEFISEVSKLRRQQPVGIGLLRELNSNYPFASDPAFYVSDLKLTTTGDLEMKGLARNKDAVATFLRALEFAGGEQSGSRLFSNLAYEIQEVGQPAVTAAQVKLPTVAGSTLTAAGAAPGIVQWKMTGNYTPVAEFLPKPAASPQPGAKPNTAPSPVVPPKAG